MRLFEKRPLCFACATALILCPVFAYTGLFSVYAALVLCAICAGAAFFLRGDTKRTLLIAAAVCTLVSVSFLIFLYGNSAVSLNEKVSVSGYVLPDSEADGTRIIKITKINGARANVSAVCRSDGVHPYERFTAEATLTRYDGANAAYYRGKGAFFFAETENFTLTGGYRRGVGYYAEKLRGVLSLCLYRASDEGAVLSRIFLGSRGGIPGTFTSDMRKIGLSHLLAVSGLHVTALLFGLDFILKKLTAGKRLKSVLLGIAALIYMAVTGFSGSVVRASVMFAIMSMSTVLIRRNDPVTSLCAAVTGIIAVNPVSVYDTGFILSFSAMLGILTAGLPLSAAAERRFSAKRPFLSALLSSVAVTASAVVFTIPPAVFSYGKLVFGALLYNAVAAPVVTLLLYTCPFVIIFSRVPLLGRALGVFCDGLCSALKGFARFFSSRSPSVSLRCPFVVPLLAALFAALIVMAFITKKRRAYAAALLCFCLIFSVFAGVYSLTFAKKTVIMVSTGKHGDTVAVISSGRATVYDFTPGYSDGFYQLTDALLGRGITHADYVVAAELTDYHLQNTAQVCSYFDIRAVYTPEKIAGTEELLLKKAVTSVTGSGKYGGAELVISGETRYLVIKDAVYCGTLGKGAASPDKGGKIVYGSLVNADKLPDIPGKTVRVLRYAGMTAEKLLKVIYVE